MTRSGGNLIEGVYGIAVWQYVPGTSNRKPYAYGIFDDPSNLSLNLLDGYDYRVSCTIIPDAEKIVASSALGYGLPFSITQNPQHNGDVTNRFVLADKMDGSVEFIYNIDNSKVDMKGDMIRNRPFVQRYHGVINQFTPGDTPNVIDVYRRYFAVKFVAQGLLEGDRLEITLDDSSPFIATHDNPESKEQYVSFKNITATVSTSAVQSESMEFYVRLYRLNDKGVEEEKTLMKYSRSFKRNYRSTVILTDIDNFGTDSGIGIEIKDEGELLEDDNIDLPWQSGSL